MMTKQMSRKKAILSYSTSVILVLFLGSVLAFNQKEFKFKINVEGSKGNFVKKELRRSEFASMEITTNYENFEVGQFDITLARGQRAIISNKVSGNNFDLIKYSKIARDGDRIIIQILEVTPSLDDGSEIPENRGMELSDRNLEVPKEKSIIVIPIK